MEMGEAVLFASFRKRIRAGLKTAKGKLKAQEFLAGLELSAAWAIYTATQTPGDIMRREESIVWDIVGKLVKYGTLSDGQINYLRGLLGLVDNRAAVEAKREAEKEAAAPIPHTVERVSVVGVVLSTKIHEGMYSTVTKMLVKCDAGYKLYGSVPSELRGIKKGTRVEFNAKIEASKDDAKFGFFSRPTKARRINEEVTL